MLFKGLGVAMVTPMNEKGINYEVTERLIEFWISGGVDCLIPLGTTGEAATISAPEKKEFLSFVIKRVNGRIPVIAGTGSNCTSIAVETTLMAEEAGANGALVVTPYYNKCTQNGIYAHYRAINDASKLPIIAYNVPGRTGVTILPQTALRLCEIDGVQGIKESSGNMEQIMETIRLTEGRMSIYSGDDAVTAPTMLMGGVGVISVAANVVPSLMSTITKSCLSRDFIKAAKTQLSLLPLIASLFCEVNPIPVKASLKLLGYDCGTPRLPLTAAETATIGRLKNNLTELGVI